MRPLRIVLISPFFPLKGGIARFSSALRATLLDEGHTVEVISFKRLVPKSFLKGKAIYESGVSPVSPTGVLPLLDVLNPLTWFAAARRIQRTEPDLIISAYWLGILAPLFSMLGRLSGRRMVVLMHNFSSHEHFFFEKSFRDLLMKTTGGVVTLSDHVGRLVRNSYPDTPVRTLFHPVYPPPSPAVEKADACRKLGIDPAGPVLLFFGYIRKYKGLDILLEAMPEITRRHPGVQLVIAGEFYYGEKMFRERIEKLGITKQVHLFAEYASGNRLALFFSAADVAVLPYRESSQSGVVQQAYGFGCPVIVSDRGGLPETVRSNETGIILEQLTPAAVAASVGNFFIEKETVPFRANVTQYVQELSWQTFVEKLLAFVEKKIL